MTPDASASEAAIDWLMRDLATSSRAGAEQAIAYVDRAADRDRHGADPEEAALRALLRRIGRHAAGDPRAVRDAHQPGLGAGAAQALLPDVRFRAAGLGRRQRHRPVLRRPAQFPARADVPPRAIATGSRRARAGVPGRAVLRHALAMEHHAGLAASASPEWAARAAASAAHARRGPVDVGVPGPDRVPGERRRRHPNSRSADRPANRRRLLARGVRPGRLAGSVARHRVRGDRNDRPRQPRAVAVCPSTAERQSLRVSGRCSAGRTPRPRGDDAPFALHRCSSRSRPARSGSDRPGQSEAWPLVRDADELHDALLSSGALLHARGDAVDCLLRSTAIDGASHVARTTECRRTCGSRPSAGRWSGRSGRTLRLIRQSPCLAASAPTGRGRKPSLNSFVAGSNASGPPRSIESHPTWPAADGCGDRADHTGNAGPGPARPIHRRSTTSSGATAGCWLASTD